MFSNSARVRRLLPVGLVLLFAGCGPGEIREQTLVGKWGAASKDGTGTALKIKAGNPNAKPAEIVAAAKILAATSLELQKDAFTLQYGAGKYEGSWKLDNADKTVEMAVKTMNGEVADVKKLLTGTFLGVMDPSDGTMRLYPVDRKGYEESKGKADSGLEVMSVRLRKGA